MSETVNNNRDKYIAVGLTAGALGLGALGIELSGRNADGSNGETGSVGTEQVAPKFPRVSEYEQHGEGRLYKGDDQPVAGTVEAPSSQGGPAEIPGSVTINRPDLMQGQKPGENQEFRDWQRMMENQGK